MHQQILLENMSKYQPSLYWDSAYAMAIALMENYPDLQPEDVGLEELAELIETLPGFADDPAMATERILIDVQIVWYEEKTQA